MNKQDIDKKYISPIDEFLRDFDETHQKTPSQLKEIKKYQRIFALRDNKDEKKSDELWTEF
ncbi:MAG: CBU_0585 family protein [Legionellaceae bacterium]|nr:CBU_0585 family protein [Legionellaceae bacterium]